MADYTWRTVKTVRREYEVPTHEPWGADPSEINKAWTAAMQDYLQTHGLSEDKPLSDNALRFFARDDAIVISFTVEEATVK